MLPKLVVPSFQRSGRQKTLAFLAKQMYPAHLIYLVVANEEEEKTYLREVNPRQYGHLLVARQGLANVRNWITEFFPEGEVLCQMDDDVADIKMIKDKSFLELVSEGVERVKNGGLFGILPNDDGRKMQDKTTTHLTHILGAFFIYTNHKDFVLTHDEKEDYARSIWYFKKYGWVARYKGAGVKTTYHQGAGGLNQANREARMEEGARRLVAQYPDECSYILKKNKPDIRLNWRAKYSGAGYGEDEALQRSND